MKNIKCPKCKWHPTSEKLWQCSCLQIFDTFDTGAICPNTRCKKRWVDTCCPKCHKWSKHLAWYSGLDKLLKIELEKINVELVLEK